MRVVQACGRCRHPTADRDGSTDLRIEKVGETARHEQVHVPEESGRQRPEIFLQQSDLASQVLEPQHSLRIDVDPGAAGLFQSQRTMHVLDVEMTDGLDGVLANENVCLQQRTLFSNRNIPSTAAPAPQQSVSAFDGMPSFPVVPTFSLTKQNNQPWQ
eukprot:1329004-Rhodomonas_salina.1